jgi:hypothetical protein
MPTKTKARAGAKAATPKQAGETYRMKLKDAQFISEFGGRLPADAVLEVDADTAARWWDRGIASIAPEGAPTYAEEARTRRRVAFERDAALEAEREDLRRKLALLDDPQALAVEPTQDVRRKQREERGLFASSTTAVTRSRPTTSRKPMPSQVEDSAEDSDGDEAE